MTLSLKPLCSEGGLKTIQSPFQFSLFARLFPLPCGWCFMQPRNHTLPFRQKQTAFLFRFR
jgi:hypothetical protein